MTHVSCVYWDGISPVENIPPSEFLAFVQYQISSDVCYVVYVDGVYSGIRDTSKTAEEWGKQILHELHPELSPDKATALVNSQYDSLLVAGLPFTLTVTEYPYDGGETVTAQRGMFFSLEDTARSNLSVVMMAIAGGRDKAPYEDMLGFCFDLLASEAQTFSDTVFGLYTALKTKLNKYHRWVDRATAPEELASISWAAPLPEDLQSIYEAHLAVNGIPIELVEGYIHGHIQAGGI